MKIILSRPAIYRHFNNDFGTIISDVTPEQFEQTVNDYIKTHDYVLQDGYADFCKLLFIENWTNANSGTIPITPDNKKFLVSKYKARGTNELPVLTRWFDGVESPRAKYLCLVLYNKEQIKKEGNDIDADFAIVAILGQMGDKEEPMPPITMMRNALGIQEGGSGVPINKEEYLKSVEFWESHAIVGK